MSEVIGRAVLEVAGDMAGFEAQMAKAEQAAARFENAATKSAGKASQALAGVGKGTGAGANELDAATRKSIAALQLLIAKTELTPAAFQQFKASLRGASDEAVGPYVQRLQQAIDKQAALANTTQATAAKLNLVGVSAGQATAALRQMPAQITDVITSLQAGQSPLTVLIQQGGQIKDSFGGVGNTFKALAASISPAMLGFAGLAAVVGTVGLAYQQGYAEAQEYRRQLILTGNAAGATVGQLQTIAQAVSASVSTQGKAAEVIAQLAGTGRVAAADLGLLTEAAVRLEREGGPAVEKTVAAFAELGRDPLKAARALNEGTNFLTASALQQIRTLQDQGRVVDAARVAQEAYATATIDRTKQVAASLGVLEKGWRAVRDAGKWAWDRMLDIGRQESVETKLAAVSAELERRRRAVGPNLSSRSNDLIGEQGVLQSDALMNRKGATIKADQARQVDALAQFGDLQSQYLTPTAALDKQVAKFKELAGEAVKTGQITQQQADAVLARVVATSSAAAQALATAQAGIGAAAARDAANLDGTLQQLQARREQGQITELAYLQAVNEAQLSAGRAEAARIQQSIELAKRVPDNAAQVRQLEGQLAAKNIELTNLEAKGHNDVAVAIYKRRLAADELTRSELKQAAAEMALAAAEQQRKVDALAIAAQEYSDAMKDGAYSAGIELQAMKQNDLQREITLKKLQIELDLRRQIRAIENMVTRGDIGYVEGQAAIGRITALAQQASDQVVTQVTANFEATGAKTISDALLNAFTNGADSGWKYLKDLAKREAIKVVFKPVIDQVSGYISALLTAGQGGTATGAGAGGNLMQTALTLSSLYGYGKTAYNWAAGLFSSGGTAAAGAYANAGGGAYLMTSADKLALYGEAGYGAAGGTAAAGGEAAGAAAGASSSVSWIPYIGWAIAGLTVSMDAYKKGFTTENADSKLLSTANISFLSKGILEGLGISNKWANILSGASGIAQLFGRGAPQITASGVMGSLSAGDFSGQAFADVKQKGGRFRRDKNWTETAALPAELGGFLDTAAKSVFEHAADFGKALGLPVDAISKVTKDIRVELTDNAKQNKDALTEALSGYGEALVAGWADAVAPLAKYGETTYQTIDRVATAITDVNDVLDALGVHALAASVDGGKAAVALEELFGGVAGLQQTAGDYLQNYYGEAERANLATAAIGKSLAEVGLTLPTTREGFRALVEAQDLTTEAGQRAFAALMLVEGAFADIVPAARSAADILSERVGLENELLTLQGNTTELRRREREALDESNRGLYDEIQALKDKNEADRKAADEQRALDQAATVAAQAAAQAATVAAQAAAQAAQSARDAWIGVWQDIAGVIARLRKLPTSSAAQALLETRFAVDTAAARSGSLAAAKRLSDQAEQLSAMYEQTSTTKQQNDLLQMQLANSLEQTMQIGGAPADQLAGLRADVQGGLADLMTGVVALSATFGQMSRLWQQFDADGLPPTRPA